MLQKGRAAGWTTRLFGPRTAVGTTMFRGSGLYAGRRALFRQFAKRSALGRRRSGAVLTQTTPILDQLVLTVQPIVTVAQWRVSVVA